MNLKPCPNCGSTQVRGPDAEVYWCICEDCDVFGPNDDADAAKWNAMPRRDDDLRLLVEVASRIIAVPEIDPQMQLSWDEAATCAAGLIAACRARLNYSTTSNS